MTGLWTSEGYAAGMRAQFEVTELKGKDQIGLRKWRSEVEWYECAASMPQDHALFTEEPPGEVRRRNRRRPAIQVKAKAPARRNSR